MLLGASKARAQDEPLDFSKALAAYTKESGTTAERQAGLRTCVGVAGYEASDDKHKRAIQRDQLRDALNETLRKEFPKKLQTAREKLDKAPTDKDAKDAVKDLESLVIAALTAISRIWQRADYPDLGPTVKPWVADRSQKIWTAALTAVHETTGAKGLKDDLLAVFDGRPGRDTPVLQHFIITCADGLPADEAVEVLGTIAQKARTPGDAVLACDELADLVLKRPWRQISQKKAQALLVDLTKGSAARAMIADAAALALWRLDMWDGVPAVFERLDGRAASEDDYTVLCRMACREGGWNDVPPGKFNQVSPESHDAALKSAHAWFEGVKGKSPEAAIWKELAAAKVVGVPSSGFDTKEAVTALIEGMDTKDRCLRYAALDLFVRRTQSFVFASVFKTLSPGSANPGKPGSIKIALEKVEDRDGFKDPGEAQALKDQQQARVAKVREWWGKTKDKASMSGGVCSESYDPIAEARAAAPH